MGMAMSLYFSEILKFPPCVLCWYQRICLYPLVIIYAIGLFQTGKECFKYALPMVGAGLLFAIFHNLLYYGIIPEAISPCVQGVSCTTKQVEWFGVLTIPLMSLISFIVLFILAISAFCHKGRTLEK